jgi:Transposase DDE domain
MESVRQVAEALQRAFGSEELEQLGRTTNLVRRRRKFTAVALLRTLVITLMKRPDPSRQDYRTTAAQLGLDVSAAALPNRFAPALTAFLREALGRLTRQVIAAPAVAIPLLQGFTSVRLGDSTTVALPDALADEFPGGGGTSGSGRAALKLQVLWDFLPGALLRVLIEPGARADATSPLVDEPAPAGSLSLFDLGDFALSRFGTLMRDGASWITRLQFGVRVFDPEGRPLALLDYLEGRPGGGPVDVSVLLGSAERLACRLIAVRVPQEVASRRRQEAREEAQKHGRAPSREYLRWQDWTTFVTDCGPERLTWKAVVVLYRVRWQIELLFKLWKSHGGLASHRPGAPPQEQLAVVYAKLIGGIAQHWILLTATWSNGRRSLIKAAKAVRDWVAHLTEALDDPGRLSEVLRRLRATLENTGVSDRRRHPSLFQLLMNPELLDYQL